jgi:hypothetical protein
MYQEKDKRISPKFSALKMGWNFVQKVSANFMQPALKKAALGSPVQSYGNACHQSIRS